MNDPVCMRRFARFDLHNLKPVFADLYHYFSKRKPLNIMEKMSLISVHTKSGNEQ